MSRIENDISRSTPTVHDKGCTDERTPCACTIVCEPRDITDDQYCPEWRSCDEDRAAAGAQRPAFGVRTKTVGRVDRRTIQGEDGSVLQVESVVYDRPDPGPELRGPATGTLVSGGIHKSSRSRSGRVWRPEIERDRSMRAHDLNPRAQQ